MKALCWHGKSDVRVDTVPDPKIEDPRDAIVRITSTCICGSDLHLYDGYMPTMEAGDVLGHEPMGVVEEVGKSVTKSQDGRPRGRPVHDLVRDLLVLRAAALLALRQLEPQRRDRRQGDGPVAGGTLRLLAHARRLSRRPGRVPPRPLCRRRPAEDPRRHPRREGRSSSPTSSRPATWPPRRREIEPGDTVAIWGCGPVGQFAIQSAWMLGAGRVIAIDRVPERLEMAEGQGKAETINFEKEDVYDTLMEMTKGRGPDRCIDAVGAEAHAGRQPRRGARQGEGGGRSGHRPAARPPRGDHVLPQRRARSRSPASTSASRDKIPIGAAMNKGLTFKMGQTHVQRYHQMLLEKIEAGEIDPSFVITHEVPLEDGPEMYKTFRDKKDGCIKVVLKPGQHATIHFLIDP